MAGLPDSHEYAHGHSPVNKPAPITVGGDHGVLSQAAKSFSHAHSQSSLTPDSASTREVVATDSACVTDASVTAPSGLAAMLTKRHHTIQREREREREEEDKQGANNQNKDKEAQLRHKAPSGLASMLAKRNDAIQTNKHRPTSNRQEKVSAPSGLAAMLAKRNDAIQTYKHRPTRNRQEKVSAPSGLAAMLAKRNDAIQRRDTSTSQAPSQAAAPSKLAAMLATRMNTNTNKAANESASTSARTSTPSSKRREMELQKYRSFMLDGATSQRCTYTTTAAATLGTDAAKTPIVPECRKWCAPGMKYCKEHSQVKSTTDSTSKNASSDPVLSDARREVLTGKPGPMDKDPQWSTVSAATRPSSGSSGVVFVRTDAGVYVVKSRSSAGEVFAMALAPMLGVFAPRMRPLFANEAPSSSTTTTHAENATEILAQTQTGETHSAGSNKQTGLGSLGSTVGRVGSVQEQRALIAGMYAMQMRLFAGTDGKLGSGRAYDGDAAGCNLYGIKPILLLIEMLPRLQVLDQMTEAEARLAFTTASADGQRRCEELGRLVAFDLYMNNSDRVPTPVWGNQGNASNVAIATASRSADDSTSSTNDGKDVGVGGIGVGGRIAAIDSQCCGISAPKSSSKFSPNMLEQHIARLTKFLEDLHCITITTDMCTRSHSEKDTERESEVELLDRVVCAMEKTRAFIERESGYDIQRAGCLFIAKGIQIGIQTILHFPENKVSALHARVVAAMDPALNKMRHLNFWRDSVRTVKLRFLERVREVFMQVCGGIQTYNK